MVAKKFNVLVYAGTGAGVGSINQCLYSLRRILYPRYAVLTVTGDTLIKEPWQDSCALLVMPGGRDKGYRSTLDGEGNRIIKHYVREGGAYMGLCAGGYYGSSRCEFDIGGPLEVAESRELCFYPDICRGPVFSGFVYDSEEGARAAELNVSKKPFAGIDFVFPETIKTYFNGGGLFVNANKHQKNGTVEVLAAYSEPTDVEDESLGFLPKAFEQLNLTSTPPIRSAAIIYLSIGKGRVILSGLHPEFATANLSRNAKGMKDSVFDELEKYDQARSIFFKALLWKLGLSVNETDETVPLLTPIQLWSLDDLAALGKTWRDGTVEINGELFNKGDQDIFLIGESADSSSKHELRNITDVLLPGTKDYERLSVDPSFAKLLESKALIVEIVQRQLSSAEGLSPSSKFDHIEYFEGLQSYEPPGSEHIFTHRFGRTILYGEVVSSTSTLLEKNPQFSNPLNTGATFLATTQVSGRGRGSNVWISAPGSLLFSTKINHPMANNVTAPVVFLQYVAALAIVEGIQTYDVAGVDPMDTARGFARSFSPKSERLQQRSGYRELPVRLKWPNDIYALNPENLSADPKDPASYVKIGGILVNTSYSDGDFHVIVGVGLNVSNSAPTTSINALVAALNHQRSQQGLPEVTLERLLARILTTFTSMYEQFQRYGFRGDLENLYLAHWLHTDQIVTLQEEGNVKAKIKGITMDWGSLVAEEVQPSGSGNNQKYTETGKKFALQADNNSFDFFKGLVRRKL